MSRAAYPSPNGAGSPSVLVVRGLRCRDETKAQVVEDFADQTLLLTREVALASFASSSAMQSIDCLAWARFTVESSSESPGSFPRCINADGA